MVDRPGSDPAGRREPAALPASVLAAWGRRARPARGPKPGLSLDRIVAAAIDVAGAEGIDGLSMNRLAAELGSAPMSLYRYVGAKQELLDLMMDAVVPDPPAPLGPGETWRDGLERWARDERDALNRHRWAIRIPRGRPPITPRQTRWLEAALRYLRDTGLTPEERLSTVLLVTGFVWNDVLLFADMAEAMEAARASAGDGHADDPGVAYGRMIAELIDAEHFPELHALVSTWDLVDEGDVDSEFEFGLARVLDGIEVLIDARRGGAGCR